MKLWQKFSKKSYSVFSLSLLFLLGIPAIFLLLLHHISSVFPCCQNPFHSFLTSPYLANDLSARVPRASHSSEVLTILLHFFHSVLQTYDYATHHFPITSLSLWIIQMFQLKGCNLYLLAWLHHHQRPDSRKFYQSSLTLIENHHVSYVLARVLDIWFPLMMTILEILIRRNVIWTLMKKFLVCLFNCFHPGTTPRSPEEQLLLK